ncbi:MAG: WD40 repeat domain-containing protein [Crocinitomicaceae bacterium]|nr:WD40 repeat domain-containing protein [Crocinitomicaceae bacterium]
MDTTVRKMHIFSDHSAAVYGLAEGRTPGTFFSASGDRYIVEWSVKSLQQQPFVVKLDQSPYCIKYLLRFNLLVAGNAAGGIHVIDTKNKSEVRHLTIHQKGVYDLVEDTSQSLLYAAGGDGCLSVWRLPDFELLRNIPFSTEKIRQLALSPDGTLLAIACGEGKVRIVDTAFFNELYTLHAHSEGATSVAWHPQKKVLVSGGKDACLHLFHTEDSFRSLMKIPAHNFAIYSIAFSPDGKNCVTASRDKTIKLWSPQSFDALGRIDPASGGHTHSVNDLLWLGNSRFLSCSDDRKIILWEM